jgi:hypothetical protein
MMAAATTTAVYVDIDTNLLDGYAWALYGIDYTITDSSHIEVQIATALWAWTLQVHRNDDHVAMISRDDDDLWIHHGVHIEAVTTGGHVYETPFSVQKPSITFSPTLRVIFDCVADITTIDDTDLLQGKLYYDIIKAPTAAQTKLGYIAEM